MGRRCESPCLPMICRWLPMRLRSFIPLLLVILAGACGRPAPEPAVQAAPRAEAEVVRPAFDDAKPHPWAGRRPDAYPVHGIDTSRWNGVIDWQAARAAGVNFAFLKATEGGDHTDPMFLENWRGARAAGVAHGAYHFWYHCRPAAEQARWFIRQVPRQAGALPPVLDMEWTPFSPTCRIRPPAGDVRAEAKIFLDMLERHYGQRPIIYTTPDFYDRNEMWRLGSYDFWLRAVTAHPQERYAGRHWTFWQYSGTGLVPGIGGRVDLNVFAGSADDWRLWLARRLHR